MQKLVRDRIPELMAQAGLTPCVRVLPSDERLGWLLTKLDEEAAELKRTPNLEECADVFEVVVSIADQMGYTVEQLLEAAHIKREIRGGFGRGLILSVNETLE